MIVHVSRLLLPAPLSLLLFFAAPVLAAALDANPAKTSANADLPDSPGAIVSAASGSSSSLDEMNGISPQPVGASAPQAQATTSARDQTVVLPRVQTVRAGQIAPPQHVRDKFLLSLRESITPFSMAGWVSSAGWSHLINSAPNYGVNSEAFAQRFGAAAATGSSKNFFSDAVFASVFRQDPRYYQLGRSHKLINRAIYAATRPVIGRTDSGKTIFNYANVLGTGASAALAQAYYPDRNQDATQVMKSWASGIGGSALGYIVTEFGGDIIQALHIERHE